MIDALPTRQAVRAIVLAMLMTLASIAAMDSYSDGGQGKALHQNGWNSNEVKNKIQHGDVTTFELGTPNYQILNPEDEPEFITEDQPHYRAMLMRLIKSANGTDVIDLAKPRTSNIDDPKTKTLKCEKLGGRSFDEVSEKIGSQDEVEALPLDNRNRHAQVYVGAKPLQLKIANLS